MADSSNTTQPQEKRVAQQGQRGPRNNNSNNNNNNTGNKRFYPNHAQPGNNTSPQGPKGDGQPRPKKNNSNNQKNNKPRNGTGAAVASNGGASAAPAPVRHNLSPEVHKKVVDLRQLTNSYFSEGDILNALQQNEFDQERALEQLNAKRTNSWSSVVKKTQGVTATPQAQSVTAEAPATQEQPQQPKKNNRKPKIADAHVEVAPAEPEPVKQQAPPKPHVDTDTKIADLEQQVAKDLSLIENKAQHLKSLQEELRSVKAERDAQIQSLKEEKERLFARRQELDNELAANKQRTVQIDKEVAHLQQEKDQKIKTLEGKYNSAILNKN